MNLNEYPCSKDQFDCFKQGDEDVFRMIFDFYKPILFNRIKYLCSSTCDAEEILQESFIQLFLKRKNIESVENVFPFLCLISKRMSISLFRKRLVRDDYQQTIDLDWNEINDSLQNQIENRDLLHIVSKAVETLPPQQRKIFTLNKIEGYNYAEIADEVGISKNTVRNHLVTACHYIRLRFENLIVLIFVIKNIF